MKWFWTIKITDRCQQLIWSHAEQTIYTYFTHLLLYCSKKFYTFNQVSNNESEQRHFTHLIRCQNNESEAIRIGECPSNSPFLKNNGADAYWF